MKFYYKRRVKEFSLSSVTPPLSSWHPLCWSRTRGYKSDFLQWLIVLVFLHKIFFPKKKIAGKMYPWGPHDDTVRFLKDNCFTLIYSINLWLIEAYFLKLKVEMTERSDIKHMSVRKFMIKTTSNNPWFRRFSKFVKQLETHFRIFFFDIL